MAAMTLADIRAFVRDSLDVTEDDLATSHLDLFIREGFNELAFAEPQWSFYVTEVEFTTTANVQAYSIEDMPVAGGGTVTLNEVMDVRGETRSLLPRDHRQMRALFRRNPTSSATPTRFSRLGRQIFLWPIPNDEFTYEIVGYREPRDWMTEGGAAGVPDLPNEFHPVIAFWALHKTLAWEDDPEMAAYYREYFGGQLSRLRQAYTKGLDAQPLILNEGPIGDRAMGKAEGTNLLWPW